jgi:spermidine/putrescine transport system ATP-binding protein
LTGLLDARTIVARSTSLGFVSHPDGRNTTSGIAAPDGPSADATLPLGAAIESPVPSMKHGPRIAIPDRAADVRLVDVTKRFGEFVAVDRMNLDIRRGAFYSLLGPSGCGKTTTLRMIAGFEQPTEGELLIAGEPVAGVPPFHRDVNTVFQHYALFPHMDVRRNVGYGLRQRGIKGKEEQRRVDEALELVRLEGYAKRRTWELSGGQQQRVALARALVNHPTVLLLDEPLGALDLKLRREMQHELKQLQHRVGITFVYVTHDQEEAITMSDVVVVMHHGRIQQQGAPQDLYERPANRFVAGFLGLSNFVPGRLLDRGPDGQARVEIAGQVLEGLVTDAAARPEPGAEVTIAVRPERVRLSAGDDPAAATESVRIPGRVSEATYLGDQNEYRVETALGELVARRQNNAGSAGPSFGPGDPVVVTWSTDANLVLAS